MSDFSTLIRVRYAEIDAQKIVFNSRYLEYADVAETEFWEWTGIGERLGALWTNAEFRVRKAVVNYLRPFVLGDTIRASVAIAALGRSSLTKRIALAHAGTGILHADVEMITVHVDQRTGRAAPMDPQVRAFLVPMVVPKTEGSAQTST